MSQTTRSLSHYSGRFVGGLRLTAYRVWIRHGLRPRVKRNTLQKGMNLSQPQGDSPGFRSVLGLLKTGANAHRLIIERLRC